MPIIARVIRKQEYAIVQRSNPITGKPEYLLNEEGEWTFDWYATMFPLAEAKELAIKYNGYISGIEKR